MQELVRRIPVSKQLIRAAVTLARMTRPTEPDAPAFVREYVEWGAGPRASQYLVLGAKARAALDGRPMADLDDVQAGGAVGAAAPGGHQLRGRGGGPDQRGPGAGADRREGLADRRRRGSGAAGKKRKGPVEGHSPAGLCRVRRAVSSARSTARCGCRRRSR